MATPVPLKASLDAAINEFLHSQDVSELCGRVSTTIASASDPEVAVEFVKRVFIALLSANDEHSEQLQFALGSLAVRGVITSSDVHHAIGVLFTRLDDWALDAPKATGILGALLAHLCLEEIVSDVSLHAIAGEPASTAAAKAIARQILTAPVPSTLQQVRGIYGDCVSAFFDSGDITVLEASIASLHARHTLHEIVRKIVQFCLSLAASSGGKVDPLVLETASDVLQRLSQSGLLPKDAAYEGFLRLLRSTADFASDVPAAAEIVPRFIARAMADGVLSPSFLHSAKAWLDPAIAAYNGASHAEKSADHAHRATVAAANALEAVAALTSGGADAPDVRAKLARVWNYSGPPLSALRQRYREIVDVLLASAAAAATSGAGAADGSAPEAAFADAVAALAPVTTPHSPSTLHPMIQCDVAFELVHTQADNLMTSSSSEAAGGSGAAAAASQRVVAALQLLLQRGILQPGPAGRAFARALQSLENAVDDEESLLPPPSTAVGAVLPSFLTSCFAVLRSCGVRSLDLLHHPSATLSKLLAAHRQQQAQGGR